jgi:hypothetical protein
MSKELLVIDDARRMFLDSSGGASMRWLTEKEVLENLVTHCRDCVGFYVPEFALEGPNQGDCDNPLGLPRPKTDGSDYCPYAQRK